ncbi:hypothetical protein JTE90_028076 [Oedothorax gibbosus]|uniref:Uncharacterized protein n=1 Tax=Oedothorax gibbosus TaxID=931172 RepID=A0AAV6V8Z8_9ARAC|nr:hypothetical protein JTE90_028076 [Oedothorax gibbosus]
MAFIIIIQSHRFRHFLFFSAATGRTEGSSIYFTSNDPLAPSDDSREGAEFRWGQQQPSKIQLTRREDSPSDTLLEITGMFRLTGPLSLPCCGLISIETENATQDERSPST